MEKPPKKPLDLVTVFAESPKPELKESLAQVRKSLKENRARGDGSICLPRAQARKYPNIIRERRWQ